MKPIAVGDLVQIVRTSTCGCTNALGEVFHVVNIRLSLKGGSYCKFCGHETRQQELLAFHPDGFGCELYRLKRIPPLDELEGVKTEESLKETA